MRAGGTISREEEEVKNKGRHLSLPQDGKLKVYVGKTYND